MLDWKLHYENLETDANNAEFVMEYYNSGYNCGSATTRTEPLRQLASVCISD